MLFWWFPDNVVCWETPETRPALVGNLIVFQDKGCSLVSLLSIQEIDNILVEPGDSKPYLNSEISKPWLNPKISQP